MLFANITCLGLTVFKRRSKLTDFNVRRYCRQQRHVLYTGVEYEDYYEQLRIETHR